MTAFDGGPADEERELRHKIDVENKIKEGAENLLHVFDLRLASSTKHDLRKQIESELDTANAKIAVLHSELQRLRTTSPPQHGNARSDQQQQQHHQQQQQHQNQQQRWHPDAEIDHVARLEASALGLDHDSLFPGPPGPSRSPDAATNYQISRMQDAFDTGSPPSSNLANEIGATRNMDGLVGGLGIGLDGGFEQPTNGRRGRFRADSASSSSAAAALPTTTAAATTTTTHRSRSDTATSRPGSEGDRERDKETEDAQATRTLVMALLRSLRSTPLRNRSGSAPLLMSSSKSTLDEAAASASSNASRPGEGVAGAGMGAGIPGLVGNANAPLAMGPPGARMNRRQITRNRVAALAGGASSGHVRTPSNADGLGDAANRQIDTMKRLVVVLKKHARARYELSLDDLVDVVMPCLADSAGKEVRAAAYRLIRHALIQPPWPLISRCRAKGLDVYLSRTTIRDNRFDVEREQALKLIRTVMELAALRTVNSAPDRLAPDLQDLLAPGVVRALAAVAEDGEDKLRHICLETLAELAVFDVRLLIRGGGLRSALQALVDAPNDFAPTLMQTFLYLIDMPGTRHFLRPGVDLDVAMSGLTESLPIKPVAYEASLRSTAKVVSTMLRSWGGLLYMCMDDKRAVKSIVLALRVNAVEVKDCILDMLYDLFNVRAAAQTDDPASKRESGQRQANVEGAAAAAAATTSNGLPSLGEMGDQTRTRLNLVDHYLALLLVVFIEAGLIDALVAVIEHTAEMSRKATLLMGELLQVSKRVHPPSMGSSIHSLPHLFALAASFKKSKSDERQAAALALSSIDRVNRQRAHHEAVTTVAAATGSKQPASRDRSNSLDETVRRGQRQVEKTKIRLGMQIDDNQFRSLMVDTQVLNTKDHVKWNLDTLTEMLEGPLMNPRRMDEVMRGTKFLKRLLSFFHPFSLRFSSIRKINSNRRFVRLGCTLLSTLLCTAEGIKALTEDRLLREVRECLEQLDPVSGTPTSDPLMSKSRLEETLTSGYFEMLGVLTQSAEGIRLLERHKVFSPLYHLSELRSRDDVIRAVIENFDYSFDGHTRVVLSKALTSNYRHIRLFATRHLAELIRRSVSIGSSARQSTGAAEDDGNEWMISLLLSQLYDTSIEVRELAVRVVEESCASIDILEKVVAMRPTLDHLGDIGHPLLLKFLSTSIGFRYLWTGDYIDREMDHWFNERNHRYAIQVEVMLAEFFSVHRTSASSSASSSSAAAAGLGASRKDAAGKTSSHAAADAEPDGTVPPHFYGELAKTAEGCEILRQKGHFGDFAHFIRQHGLEHSDAELINKLKSVLWAVGNIGSTTLGLPFLEAEDVISQIIEIAENSLVMSVRGTCFFVLGLISATTQGSELLQDYGWISVCTPLGVPLGLCLPSDVGRLVSMPTWDVEEVLDLGYLDFCEPDTVLENKAITSIANLGNSILANNASRTLAKLKLKHKATFEDVALLTRAVELMDCFYIRLPVRRYIWELFDVSLGEDVVQQMQHHRRHLVERKRAERHGGGPGGRMGPGHASPVRRDGGDAPVGRGSGTAAASAGTTPRDRAASSTTPRRPAVRGIPKARHLGLQGMADEVSDDGDGDGIAVDSDLDHVGVGIDSDDFTGDDDDDDDDDEDDLEADEEEGDEGESVKMIGQQQQHQDSLGTTLEPPAKLAMSPRKRVLGFAVS
ncbi:related to protein ste16 [Pseudozyma flocculosa]|uniref:Related to protein ste16 n=1 Tax=Pseudozyma flocculosa TaxID=84751 RepID=A0A5C3F7N1_9BASI|nr:related to protein ste16 [Pseudozyma flocculosa]